MLVARKPLRLFRGRGTDGQGDGRAVAQDGIAHGFDTAEVEFFVLGVIGRRRIRGGRLRDICHHDVLAFLVCVGELVGGRAQSVAGCVGVCVFLRGGDKWNGRPATGRGVFCHFGGWCWLWGMSECFVREQVEALCGMVLNPICLP